MGDGAMTSTSPKGRRKLLSGESANEVEPGMELKCYFAFPRRVVTLSAFVGGSPMSSRFFASFFTCVVSAFCLAQGQPSKPGIFDQVAAEKTGSPRARPTCQKNISFAWVSRGGDVVSETPGFADKWIAKNGNKHPVLCFDQSPASGIPNYLLVFSTSQTAFNGFHPTVKTTVTTNTSPISGNGTAIDNRQSRGHVVLHFRRVGYRDYDDHNARKLAIYRYIEHPVPSQL